jgi:hypothetical protein
MEVKMVKSKQRAILWTGFMLLLMLNIASAEDALVGLGFSLDPRESYLGVRKYERVGYALSAAGDVNGDGYGDFLVGTFHNSQRGYDAGAAYLILGHSLANNFERQSLSSANARFTGRHSYDAVGSSVAGPGDLNGDGLDDIVIGAPAGNSEVPENPGHVFIVFGKKSADWGWNFILEASANVNLVGELAWEDGIQQGGLAGFTTTIIGDLDGDGCDELLVSAPYWDGFRADGGKVYLIRGRQNGWPEWGLLVEQAEATFLSSSSRAANLGFSMAALGDVNGDLVPDFAMGAPGVSQGYVFYGRPQMDWGKDFPVEDADVILSGESARHQAGRQVIGPGDVNGDGLNDLVISAIRNHDTYYDAGKISLILGRRNGWPHSLDLAEADASWCGEAADDYAGWSLAAVGDHDGDHLNDFIIGMFNDLDRSKPGRAYYIGGRLRGWPQEKNLAELSTRFLGEESGDLTGFCVSGAGDVNGDGLDDFLVACPYYSKNMLWGGQILLFSTTRNRVFVSGKVLNSYTKDAMPGVSVSLQSQTREMVTSDSLGEFKFTGWEQGDYQLSAALDSVFQENRDFISACDAAAVARHVTGIDVLTEREQVAADVDFDLQVTLLDAAKIFQFCLHGTDNSHFGQWVFSPTERKLTAISGDQISQNFLGVILGNADGEIRLSRPSIHDFLSKVPDSENWIETHDSLLLPIQGDSLNEVLAFNLTVVFDPNLWAPPAFLRADALQEFEIQSAAHPGEFRVAGYALHPVSDLIGLGQLQFHSPKPAATNSKITVQLQINNEPAQVYKYQIIQKMETDRPTVYELNQNFPNPFNATTVIKYALAATSPVVIKIFNALGQQVFVQDFGRQPAGYFEMRWHGSDNRGNRLPSGIYFYQITTEHFSQMRKCVLIY